MKKIIEIKAPEILGGESITEGIVKIKKNVGEIVKLDDLIFEIETDKTALELTSEFSGKIIEFLVREGDAISPGQTLAKFSIDNNLEETENDKQEEDLLLDKKVSPSARKIIQENTINIKNIKGTSINDRITKADVINYINKTKDCKENESKDLEKNTLSTNIEEKKGNFLNIKRKEKKVKMSKIRQVIAARLKQSQNTAATLTTFNEIDMKNLITIREKYKENFEKKYGIKMGFMSFFIKVTVQALKDIPEINAEILGNEIVYKYYYNIGVAVGTEKGLIVPVIKNADQMSLYEIELTLYSLAKKARDGKIEVSEMEDATFTISNGGVYGSLISTPIINPPQSGILGMHSIKNRPIAINNSIEIRPMMYVAFSYDHRIIDGKEAITFLTKIKNYIEDINRLILEI